MPFIDKIILGFFILSIPLAIGLKSLNLYLEEKTDKDSKKILYSDFKGNYFLDVKNLNKSFENVKKIRNERSVKMGSVASCLTFSRFNQTSFIKYSKFLYKENENAIKLPLKQQQLLNWCNEYQNLKDDTDPTFFFYNYYYTKGLDFLYGINENFSIKSARIFFEKARNKKPTTEITKILSIIDIIELTYPNFKDESKILIINEYLTRNK